MKKTILIIFTVLLTVSIYPGDKSRKGTTGADQLLVPVGARSISTSGAFVATVDGLESIYYNPAGLDLSKKSEVMFSYMNYIADINMSYLAVGTNLGDFGSVGLSLKSFDIGDIPITTNELPDGTGSTYSPSFLTIGLTYSKTLTDRVSIGTNVKFINETIGNTSANGFAIDAGVQYKFNDNLSIGATINNIGPNMSYSGQDLRVQTGVPGSVIGAPNGTYEVVAENFQIPSYFQLSLAYQEHFDEQNKIMLASTFVANNALDDVFNFGLEYSYINTLFIRGGYQLVTENSEDSIFGFTAGAGVNYEIGTGMGVTFDYAYRDVSEFPTSNHIFTVKLAFQ
ncbi:MAG: PorV/PorQ family protein [Ignavibacteriaceae bacterium]|nr:PorV/PorQ family protein [Ignavibacterium sp.]MCC6254239.1 PorV/PorQ family protein [Ignavibacteriaceae bacterium]HMN25577.1 PorV/PorQ family protein [Ignavibacteriaceae bacterium]HRN26913.1 PorV/PorQ family protein [Ignavibacteriaceae bacterium]